MVFVFHRPLATDRFAQLSRSAFFRFKAGDKVASLSFDLIASFFNPFAGDSDKLFRPGKAADLFANFNPGDAATFTMSVVPFPFADPFVGNAFGKEFLRSLIYQRA